MDATQAPHPTEQTLHAYGLGKLDDSTAESVNKHLESCAPCRRLVAELTSDSFLGRLRDAQARPDSHAPLISSTGGLSMLDGEVGSAQPPPSSTLPPGLVDRADYEILRELGRGGMGVVYLARNKLMGRAEVLKVVSSHLVNRRGVLDRFLAEIRNAAKLHHTNVVTAYSALRLGESLVLAMQYVEGLDLARLVDARGPLPVAQACNYVHQAAKGLQHAHEHGMVHRDIKPSNLMLTREGDRAVIKVLDFGLAKVKSERPTDGTLTCEGQMLGTPHFIAPEQISDAREADIRADIYSLGCTLYYLLTSGPPFQGPSLYDILQAHQSMVAKPLNLSRPEVPVELAALVAKMMAKEPRRRFQEPKEVAQALTAFFKKGDVAFKSPGVEISRAGQTGSGRPMPGVGSTPTYPATSDEGNAVRLKKAAEPSAPAVPWQSLIDLGETERSRNETPAVGPTRRPPWLRPSIAVGVVLFGLLIAWWILIQIQPAAKRLSKDKRAGQPSGEVVAEHSPTPSPIPASNPKPNPNVAELDKTGKADAAGRAGNELAQARAKVTPGSPNRRAEIISGTWQVDGEELVQTVEADRLLTKVLFGDPNWTDYDFTVDLMGSGYAYLYVSSTDQDQYRNQNLIALEIPSGPANLFLVVYENGNRRYLFDGRNARELHLDPLKWYTARVRVAGNHIECTLRDGEKVLACFEKDDNLHSRGRVGLGTSGTPFRFKNIKVTALDGKVLWEELPVIDAQAEGELAGAADKPEHGEKEQPPQLAKGATGPLNENVIILSGRWGRKLKELLQTEVGAVANLVLGEPTWSSYDMRFKAMVVEPGSFWVTFHRTSPDNFASVIIGGDGENALRYRFRGREETPAGVRTPPRIRPGRWYDVRLRVLCQEFWCYLDGRELFHRNDGPLTKGRVGFGTGQPFARFRDIVVTTPDADRFILWEGPPNLPGPTKLTPVIHSGSWRIEGKDLVQKDIDFQSSILLDPGWPAAYDLKFEARVDAGAPGFRVFIHNGGDVTGCCFRLGDPGNENRAKVLDAEGRHASRIEGIIKDTPIELGKWYEVQVTVDGAKTSCYLNGQEWFRGRIPPSRAGRVGFGTEKTAARFRNIRITSIPGGGELWKGLPELPRE